MYKKLQKIIIIQTPETHQFTIGQKNPLFNANFQISKFHIYSLLGPILINTTF
jgi:hypothetical protein